MPRPWGRSRVDGPTDGSCPCGKLTFRASQTTTVMVCHCFACDPRDKTYADPVLGKGVPFVGIPRASFSGSAVAVRASPFSEWIRCGDCGANVALRHDCEPHTEWVLAPTLHDFDLESHRDDNLAHIHSLSHQPTGGDGCPSSIAWGSWEPDLCRPPGAPAPDVCRRCFQTKSDLSSCACASGSLEPPEAIRAVGLKHQRHRLLIYAMLFLFNVPLNAVLPTMTEYVVARRCVEMKSNTTYNASFDSCWGNDDDAVSASASAHLNVIWLSCNIPNMLTALALGTLSDLHGRRPLLLFNLATQAVGSFGMAFVVMSQSALDWFMPFFVINGLGGGSWVFYALMTASLTDTTSSEAERAASFSVFMGLFYGCGAVGPVLGGQLTTLGEWFRPEQCGRWCEGGSAQPTFLLFFGSNVLLLLLGHLSALPPLRHPLCKEGGVLLLTAR